MSKLWSRGEVHVWHTKVLHSTRGSNSWNPFLTLKFETVSRPFTFPFVRPSVSFESMRIVSPPAPTASFLSLTHGDSLQKGLKAASSMSFSDESLKSLGNAAIVGRKRKRLSSSIPCIQPNSSSTILVSNEKKEATIYWFSRQSNTFGWCSRNCASKDVQRAWSLGGLQSYPQANGVSRRQRSRWSHLWRDYPSFIPTGSRLPQGQLWTHKDQLFRGRMLLTW